MRKFLPYVFPLIAVMIVIFLLLRWYSIQTAQTGKINEEGQVVELRDLFRSPSSTPSGTPSSPASDYLTQELEPIVSQNSGQEISTTGSVRYEIKNNQLLLSVFVQPMTTDSGFYQVWWQKGESLTKAFVLTAAKGGLIGSASISLNQLPLELLVTHEQKNDNQAELKVLKGSLKQ